MRRPRLTRALRPAATVLLAAALLTACGDETSEDAGAPTSATATDPAARVLSPRIASAAVLDDTRSGLAILSQTNLGPDFQPGDDEVAEETEAPTTEVDTSCDADTAFEDRFDPDGLALGSAGQDYLLIDDVRLLVVTSVVSSFGDEDTATAAFDTLTGQLADCTHFESAADDGSGSTVLDVAIDDEKSTEDVDAQFDMVGGGSWSIDTESVPVSAGFSLARVDNNVTMTVVLSLGTDQDSTLLAPYTEIAVNRLVAVAAGEMPEEVAAPQPEAIEAPRLPPTGPPRTLAEFYAAAPGILARS